MTLHYKSVLDKAEKLIERIEKKTSGALGLEIESTDLTLLDEKEKKYYTDLYREAKEKHPEIWTCTAATLPDDAYYDCREFFEELFTISQLDRLCGLYPERREELKGLYAAEYVKIENMYWSLYWWKNHHAEKPDYEKLLSGDLWKLTN